MPRPSPRPVVRFIAKTDTSVSSTSTLSTPSAPMMATMPTASGSRAAMTPRKMKTSRIRVSGSTRVSASARSSWVCSFISA